MRVRQLTCFFISLFFLVSCAGAQETAAVDNQLKLLGTVVADDPAQSFAVIGMNGQQTTNKTGETAFGYRIVKIVRGAAYLFKDDQLTMLGFPEGGVADPVIMLNENEAVIDRKAVGERIADKNPFSQVTPIPVVENGQMIGFRLSDIKDKELAHMAGIEEDDVITAINGMKIDSIPAALGIYFEARGQQKVTVELKRGDASSSMVYYLK